MLQAHDQVKDGMGIQPIITFVESHLQLMVYHHKVNMKMDYMTDQTDHNSFIIICLFLMQAFLKHSIKWTKLCNLLSVWSFCHMREDLLEYLCLTDAE